MKVARQKQGECSDFYQIACTKSWCVGGYFGIIFVQNMVDEYQKDFAIDYGESTTYPECLAISSNEEYFAAGFTQGGIQIFSIENGKSYQSYNGHPDPMTAIAISSDGKKCISASMSCLRFWRLDLDQPLQTKISYSEGPITSVDISENLKFGLVASLQSIKLWSLEEGDLPQEYAIIPAYNMGKVRFNKSSTKKY